MSEIFGKVWSKLLAVIVIVLFIVGFKEMIINDSDVSAAFGALMGTLPFAKLIADVVCKLMKYQNALPIITSTSVISDFLKLAVMAGIQPIVVGLLSLAFLKVPGRTYHEREEYMKGSGYQIKEMILTILSAPLISLLASHIVTLISGYLTTNFSPLLANIAGVTSVIVVTLISAAPLAFMGGITFGTALLWRVSTTLLGKMIQTMILNAICIWLYLSIAGGLSGQTLGAIFSLIVWLIISEAGIRLLQQSIVGTYQNSN